MAKSTSDWFECRASKAERIGFEEGYKLAWQRGGHRRLVIARVKYRVLDDQKASTIENALMPAETFPRSLAAPSLLAHIITEKHLQGLPLYRLEDRFLEDGRLRLDNNHSEGELRRIAVGRKAWLFLGSDDLGTSAGHLFSLIASARLYRLDPEEYLRDLFRVLGQWPRDRYLELAPKYWAATRARLNQSVDQGSCCKTAHVPPITAPSMRAASPLVIACSLT